MYELGRCLGIAFQIQDDILGIYSDEMGKVIGSDIKEFKQTILYSYLFENSKEYLEELLKYYGKNNIQNSYLTLKFANKMDYWFHTKDIHGSHVILKCNENAEPTEEILYKCAELASKHSKARNSSNVPVDFCLVKYVKKPNGAKPGMVIYTNNKTIFVK